MRVIVVALLFSLLFVAHGGAQRNAKKLPTFSRVLLLEQTAETSANASIGDLNGDGFPDLILAKGQTLALDRQSVAE